MGWSFNQRKAVAQMEEQRPGSSVVGSNPASGLAGGSRTIPPDLKNRIKSTLWNALPCGLLSANEIDRVATLMADVTARDLLANLQESTPPSEFSLSERLQYWATYNPELPGLLIMDLVEASDEIRILRGEIESWKELVKSLESKRAEQAP